jgi:glycosyltransferase involved in cell wall biosynthesis
MTQIEKNPLVSVIVVTYNSSKYVLETLESAKAQTYSNIELIITDDCSKDNTVEVCKQWLERNKTRFVNIRLVTTKKNTGIPGNCNRGLNTSKGELLKFIAGDDVILPGFIEQSLKEFQKDNNIAVTYTNAKIIDEKSNFVRNLPTKKYKSGYIFKEIFFVDFWPAAPSFMFKRDPVIEVGGFDETIGVEDYLLILKLAQKYKIQHINAFLTFYRMHGSNTSKDRNFLFDNHLKTINQFKNYKGYNKRVKQLKSNLIYGYAKTDKKEAIKLILKNINTLSFEIIWLKILFRLFLPQKLIQNR